MRNTAGAGSHARGERFGGRYNDPGHGAQGAQPTPPSGQLQARLNHEKLYVKPRREIRLFWGRFVKKLNKSGAKVALTAGWRSGPGSSAPPIATGGWPGVLILDGAVVTPRRRARQGFSAR